VLFGTDSIGALVGAAALLSAWAVIKFILGGVLLVVLVFRKLTRSRSVTRSTYGHVVWLLLGAAPAIGGLGAAVRPSSTAIDRLAGLAFCAAGLVILAAEWRDLRMNDAEQREARENPTDGSDGRPEWTPDAVAESRLHRRQTESDQDLPSESADG
jgi:hypothetical protein